MRIYRTEFIGYVKLDLDPSVIEAIRAQEGAKIDLDNFTEEDEEVLQSMQIIDGKDGNFYNMVLAETHVGANNFENAVQSSRNHLIRTMGYGLFEIRSVAEVDGLVVVNWGEGKDIQFQECDCAYCRAEKCAEEDLMFITCPDCSANLKVADGWQLIECSECGVKIKRTDLVSIGQGTYIVSKTEEIKPPRKNSRKRDKNEL